MNRLLYVRGFTLLELLVVIVLMSLVIGVVATNFSGAVGGSELKAESRKLVALLRHTRSKAISQSQTLALVSLDEGTRYQIKPEGKSVLLPGSIVVHIKGYSDNIIVVQPGIYFYPDGSSNGGTMMLSADIAETQIKVNGLTGETSIASSQ